MYIYTHIYIYIFTCTYICIHINMHIYTYTYIYINIHICMYTHTRTHMYTLKISANHILQYLPCCLAFCYNTRAHTHKHTRKHKYTHTRKHTHTHTHKTHTHTHTHTPFCVAILPHPSFTPCTFLLILSWQCKILRGERKFCNNSVLHTNHSLKTHATHHSFDTRHAPLIQYSYTHTFSIHDKKSFYSIFISFALHNVYSYIHTHTHSFNTYA